MVNVSNEQKKEAFTSEKQRCESIMCSSCSCNVPTRMFWFTAEEVKEENDE